jgi:hypothetical protein
MPFSAVDHKDVLNQSIASGATATVDVNVEGYSFLTVFWQLMGTTTGGDLTLQQVLPYKGDGTTVVLTPLPSIRAQTPVSDGANINAAQQLDVRGIKKIQIQAKNNNVGAKICTITVMLGTTT